ncbi:hypothetical protein ABI244_00645 [Serratia ureilytica]|uniref:hypothetical protein n=1 Tax=Serratia ureilytica TaxID=300181 RepID=UPI002366F9F2|nr:hypothetical protein [Serratia ureilytica]WDF87996.1 hypothetical protein PTZ17_10025 [Serratia ureilytica]
MQKEDGGVLTLSFSLDNPSIGYSQESISVWEITEIKFFGDVSYEIFTIPESEAFEVGIKIKNTNEVCMKVAVSPDCCVYPLGNSDNIYPSIGHSCHLDRNIYTTDRKNRSL